MAVVSTLEAAIRADTRLLKSDYRKAVNETRSFTRKVNSENNRLEKGFQKVGGAIAAAFAAERIADFTREAVLLSGQAEGVRRAFARLDDLSLRRLQVATAGTVSELDLMQRSVQAVNLGLKAADLPTFFEFATKRAQETGESVDFLVQSIVTGIGRKSPLILDNLGISATRLRDKIKETGDFAKAAAAIINEELGKSGPIIKTAATEAERLSAEFKNLKLAIGDAINEAGGADAIGSLANLLKLATAEIGKDRIAQLNAELQILETRARNFPQFEGRFVVRPPEQQEVLDRIKEIRDEIASIEEIEIEGSATLKDDIELVNQKLKETNAEIKKLLRSGATEENSQIKELRQQAIDLKAELAELTERQSFRDAFKNSFNVPPEVIETIGSLELQIKGYREELEKIPTNDKAKIIFTENEIKRLEEQVAALRDLARVTGLIASVPEIPVKLEGLGRESIDLGEVGSAEVDTSRIRGIGIIEDLRRQLAIAQKEFEEAFTLEQLDEARDKINSLTQALSNYTSKTEENTVITEQFGRSLGFAFAQGIVGAESFAEAIRNTTRNVLAAFLAEALGAAIKSGFTFGGPAGPVIAAGLVGAVQALFSSIPSFAQGGIVSAPLIAQVGDSPRGPEVIAPLSDLEGMIGGNVHVTGELVAKGGNLIAAIRTASKQDNRLNGGRNSLIN